MKKYIYAILLLLFVGCNKREGNYSNNNNLNCPNYYSKIENVYWADHDFVEPLDSTHQYWYRLITFSEEEGNTIIVEKLRQGIAEGMGKLEVVDQRNITHLKGINDVNGISLRYNFVKWINPKEIVLQLDQQSTEDIDSFKIINLENLSVKDSVLK